MTDTEIFKAAAKLSGAQRADYLDRACRDNTPQRREIDSLLRAHEQPGSFLENGAVRESATIDPGEVTERPGTLIGPYKLMEQIGEGGMGLVFVAEQQQPIRRRVALKIIKPGMDSKQVIARFEAERQALAMMDHLNIARVLDAATTESGRPYFVMELVHGVPITEYCDANRLTPRQRLELFVPVCHAIQHAHQKGIIHRDIKPSNILVTMYDDKPVPKVIDFGVAKAIEQRLTERTVYTQFGSLVGTLEYMSPEQAEMNAFGVDTRSDVYSLGVLLYELLTGTTPLERGRLREAGYGEIVRLIREEEALRPSVRLSTSGTLAKVAAARKTDPARLSRLVRGELDWVVMRCLEKDRTRRYATANGLARDVERLLRDEPVEACPPSIGYRLTKAARKHKASLGIAAGFAATLLAAFALVTWKWQEEKQARARADEASIEAAQKTEELRVGAERMNAATAAMDLSRNHRGTGLWTLAESEANRAIDLRPDLTNTWMQRGEFYAVMGLWNLAASDHARMFEMGTPGLSRYWYNLALLYALEGRDADYQRVCADMHRRFANSDDRPTRSALFRAVSLAPRVLSRAERRVELLHEPISHPHPWFISYFRGLSLSHAGQYEEAIREFRASLGKTQYPARAMNYPALAIALHHLGQRDPARQELALSRRELDRWTGVAMQNPARFVPWEYWHDWAEFQVIHREAHRLLEGSPPPDDPRLSVIRGRALAVLGRHDDASAQFDRATTLAPTEPAIRSASLRFHAQAKRWTEADADLAALVALEPQNVQHRVDAFRAFAENGRWDRAIAELDAAIRTKPDDARIRLERYRYHAARGETAEADAAFADAIKDRQGDIAFRLSCADACAEFGQWEKARAEYSVVLDAPILGDGQMNRSAWLRLAELQVHFGDMKAYQSTCRRLVERHGTDASVPNAGVLARVCLLHPEPGVPAEQVLALARRNGEDRRDRAWFSHILALAAIRTGSRELDAADVQAGLDAFNWTTQRVALALVWHHSGDRVKSRSLMAQVPPGARQFEATAGLTGRWESPLESSLWYRQAEAVIQSERWKAAESLMNARQYTGAVQAFDSLLKSDHPVASDWISRSYCHGQLGNWKEAAADSARALALDPNDYKAVSGTGLLALRLGDVEGYRTHCHRMIERFAASANAMNLARVAWLCTLDPAAEADAAAALACIEKAISLAVGRSNRDWLVTRGILLYRAGRFADAQKQLTDVLAEPGHSPTAFELLPLAMVEMQLGQRDAARSLLDRAEAWLAANRQAEWFNTIELERFRAEARALIAASK